MPGGGGVIEVSVKGDQKPRRRGQKSYPPRRGFPASPLSGEARLFFILQTIAILARLCIF
jgi:hypothetical protein